MTARTARLHEAFLNAVAKSVHCHSNVRQKPLLVDTNAAEPLRLRIYMYSLVGGVGERARNEYKIVLRVPGQGIGEYGEFDHSCGRFTTIVGYDPDLDVFVFWDASLHPKFKNGGNLQVRDDVVRAAASTGVAEQIRILSNGARELVLACQTPGVRRVIEARIATTGGLAEGECSTFLS